MKNWLIFKTKVSTSVFLIGVGLSVVFFNSGFPEKWFGTVAILVLSVFIACLFAGNRTDGKANMGDYDSPHW